MPLPNVCMFGTGEYTTGFTPSGASKSDKSTGVTALVMLDLKRRGKVGRIGMCGTDGRKLPLGETTALLARRREEPRAAARSREEPRAGSAQAASSPLLAHAARRAAATYGELGRARSDVAASLRSLLAPCSARTPRAAGEQKCAT